MEYSLRDAAEILDLSEREIESFIKKGLLVARWEDGEWVIPEWGIRVFRRTRHTLEKIDIPEDRFEKPQAELLEGILGKLSTISDFSSLLDSFAELYVVLQKKIFELEKQLRDMNDKFYEVISELERKRNVLEQDNIRLESRLKFLEQRLDDMLKEKIKYLSDRISKIEQQPQVQNESERHNVSFVNLPAEKEVQKEGFWSRFLRMLTWD